MWSPPDRCFGSSGRMHHQAGAVPGGPPAGHRGRGNRRGMSAGKSTRWSHKRNATFMALVISTGVKPKQR